MQEEYFYEAEDLESLKENYGSLGKIEKGGVQICRDLSNRFLVVKFRKLNIKEKKLFQSTYQDAIATLREIKHVNLVATHGLLLDNDFFGIVMDYFPIGNLKSVVLNTSVPIAPLLQLRICSEMATGICCVASWLEPKNEFIGNLKPENVLFSEKLQVKLTGFMDRKFRFSSLSLKNPVDEGNSAYDLIYFAPEAQGTKHLDDFTSYDVYSLGMVMHMVLSRDLPCPRDDSSISKFLKKLKRGDRAGLEKIDQLKEELRRVQRYDDLFTIEIIEDAMKACWEHDAYSRPKIKDVSSKLFERLRRYSPSVLHQHTDDAVKNMGCHFLFDESKAVPLQKIFDKIDKPSKPLPPPKPSSNSIPTDGKPLNQLPPTTKQRSSSISTEVSIPTAPPRRKTKSLTNTASKYGSDSGNNTENCRDVQRYVRGPLFPPSTYSKSFRSNNLMSTAERRGDLSIDESNFILQIESVEARLEEDVKYGLDELDRLLQFNTSGLLRISRKTCDILLKLLSLVDSYELMYEKVKLLYFSLRLFEKTFNKEERLFQIKQCAESAYATIVGVEQKFEMKDAIEEHIYPFLQECSKLTNSILLNDQSFKAEAQAWCHFYLGSCCNFLGKHTRAEAIARDALWNIRKTFSDNACKHSVMAFLYEVRASSRFASKQYEKAASDYKTEIEMLKLATDLTAIERKKKLVESYEQLEITTKIVNK